MNNAKSDSDQPWHSIGGLIFAVGSDLTSRTAAALDPADQSPLASAIRATFPDSSPAYWHMIAIRYRALYCGVTEHEAVEAVLKGYASPVDAMRHRVIPRRNHFGGFEYRRKRPIEFKSWITNVAWITDDAAGWFIDEMQTIFEANTGPPKPIANLESLLDFIRSRGGDDSVLDAAKDAWRRYQLWIGVRA
jgi:hypothetical protein